jgi:Motility quorum-sensing regulator, toxin of MqsA
LNDARNDFDFTEERLIQEILNLKLQDLNKTMPSEKKPALWQDVYKKRVIVDGRTQLAYIKLSITTAKAQDTAVIISFHRA